MFLATSADDDYKRSMIYFKKSQASLTIYKACISTRYQRSTIEKATFLFILSLIHGNRTDYFIFCMNYSKAQICY